MLPLVWVVIEVTGAAAARFCASQLYRHGAMQVATRMATTRSASVVQGAARSYRPAGGAAGQQTITILPKHGKTYMVIESPSATAQLQTLRRAAELRGVNLTKVTGGRSTSLVREANALSPVR